MGVGIVGLQGFEGAAFDFKGAAFDLEADETFGEVGAGSLVHFLTIDENRDGIAVANRREGIPFADGFFDAIAWTADLIAANLASLFILQFGTLFDRGAIPEIEITLVIMHALAFDALGPDRIGGRHVHDDARVARFSEAPLDREAILLIAFFGAQKAAGLADAGEQPVLDRPSIFEAVGRKGYPTDGVLAVKKFGLGAGRGRVGGEGIDGGRRKQGGQQG